MNWKLRKNIISVEDIILGNLGAKSTNDINNWFIKSRNNEYHIDGLVEAAELLLNNKDKQIVICGDYDADGTMATSILYLALKEKGFQNIDYLIPHRHTEGFGLNMRMIEEIYEKYGNNVCIITVDNGIVAFEPVKKAKEYGWDVIITDHHIGETKNDTPILPEADIVINPSFLKNTADFSKYCGAGIAYKLAIQLIGESAKKLMPLAAIATFADVVTLQEENYVFARDGLNYINNSIAPSGLLSLIAANELEMVCDTDILFKIAPQINAPGRLYPDGANKIVELMIHDNTELADEIISDNEERKSLVADALEVIDSEFKNNSDEIIVTYIPNINPGIVGIVAGQITEKKKRPSIVLTDSWADTTLLMGSCRSVPDVNIKELLDAVCEHIAFYGGHAGAAGTSIKKEKLNDFKEAILKELKSWNIDFSDDDILFYDYEIKASDIKKTIQTISKYAPFGEGNPKLVFKVTDFRTLPLNGSYFREIGKSGIKLNSLFGNAIAFDLRDQTEALELKESLSLIGSLSMNVFRGKATPQVEYIDIAQDTL